MNKGELVDALSGRLGDKHAAQAAVDSLVDTIMRTVATGERVIISGFGVFERRDRAPRTARNPSTGESVPVDRRVVPNFRPGIDFKEIVSGVQSIAETAGASVQQAKESAARAARTATTAPRTAVEGAAAKVAETAVQAVGRGRRREDGDLADATSDVSDVIEQRPDADPPVTAPPTAGEAEPGGQAEVVGEAASTEAATKAPRARATRTRSTSAAAPRRTRAAATQATAAPVPADGQPTATPPRTRSTASRKTATRPARVAAANGDGAAVETTPAAVEQHA